MRAVSVLQVSDPVSWAELEATVPLAEHVEQALDACRRVVRPSFDRELLPLLQGRVLVRYARRDAREIDAARHHLADEVAALKPAWQRVLHGAQRHALDEVVVGRQAWDPVEDLAAVRALHGAGLLQAVAGDLPYEGRYRLHPDLPPPPEVVYDLEDAVMDETDDLEPSRPGPVSLLHDLASLAAALEHLTVHLTTAGTVAVADGRRVGERLASDELASGGRLEEHPRWGRAWRGLQALHMVGSDPLSREVHLDLGLERVLQGSTEDATDRLVHRLVERDLHTLVPAVRAALRQAGDGAVDELVFLELLAEQHRDVLFPAWSREGRAVYPHLEGDRARAYDAAGFEAVEVPMIKAVLGKLARLGLVRRAPGVFAGTEDGRRWAGAHSGPQPPVWVSGDLEVIVPPEALTVWERFQVERLGACLQRDVVDRFRLERAALITWLSTHEVGEALDLLRRRCPAVPRSVEEALHAWAEAAERVVLVRGVLLED